MKLVVKVESLKLLYVLCVFYNAIFIYNAFFFKPNCKLLKLTSVYGGGG